MSNAATLAGLGRAAQSHLTNLLHPTANGGWRDAFRSGWVPAFHNQQWGGAQWGMMPDNTLGDVATGFVQDDTSWNIGDVAGNVYTTMSFVLSEGMTNPTIWLKLSKQGQPTDNLVVGIYSNNAGSPSALIGSTSALSNRLIQQTLNGGGSEWYPIYPTPGALLANTTYHIVISRSGALDASNYPVIRGTSGYNRYPFGFLCRGTSAPAWTQYTNLGCTFLVQNTSATQMLQTGGQFNSRFIFNEGNPLNQSRALRQDLKNFYDGTGFTAVVRGSTFAKDRTIADFAYGVDHDRIVLRCNATTGYPSVTFYSTSGTAYTVTGTSDISTSTFKDIGIKVRTMADGNDFLYLYVNGVSVGTPLTNQTFAVDPLMRDLGTATLGGGFNVAPTWNTVLTGASLPTSQGWTYSGTIAEGTAVVTGNNKIVINSYSSATGTASYVKTTTLSNATGWVVSFKMRTAGSSNTSSSGQNQIVIEDGVKRVSIAPQEYYAQITSGLSNDFYVQYDNRTQEHVYTIVGKGSDYYVYVDGKLIVDGTGRLTVTSTNNQVTFGDLSSTSGESSNTVWSYFKIYQGAFVPQFSAGAILSEFAYWTGDRSYVLPAVYNNGTPVSVRRFCGIGNAWVNSPVPVVEKRLGIAGSPSTTSNVGVIVPDMEVFLFGTQFDITSILNASHSVANGNMDVMVTFDGYTYSQGINFIAEPVAGYNMAIPVSDSRVTVPGLHKAETRWYTNTGTMTGYTVLRNLKVTCAA